MPAHLIHTDEEWFKDSQGRRLILRGINLPAKTPRAPDIDEVYERHKEVSFVGRPFPKEEIEEHFSRLKRLGFTTLRLGVPWEALEHAGPGIYDQEYLDYLLFLVKKAEEFHLLILIDFHQDVWSRFTGGDGAPGWTLESVGFDLANFSETQSALFFDQHSTFSPHIIWATNAYKLGCATMFTLFFGGDLFAPKTKVEGKPIQEFLQERYFAFMQTIATHLKPFRNIIGYDIMNEPLQGYIGNKDLNHVFGIVKLGVTPTPFQSMLLGDGNTLSIDLWDQKWLTIRKVGERVINQSKVRAWKEGSRCIWQENGVWEYTKEGSPYLLDPQYFYKRSGKKIDFNADFYQPFVRKALKLLKTVDTSNLCFIENAIGLPPPPLGGSAKDGIVFSVHWYDAFVLVMKKYFSWIGFDMIHMKKILAFPHLMRPAFARQIHHLKHVTTKQLGHVPMVITEFGIPFDLGSKKAYATGDFSLQNKALNRSCQAIEDNLISAMVWNYTGHNSNKHGDDWNQEDLSIFSKDQQTDSTDPYSGIRAKEAIIRPYAMKIPGLPTHMHFNWKTGRFDFTFIQDPLIDAPLEIFVPSLHYAHGVQVEYTDGRFEVDYEAQILYYTPSKKTLKHSLHLVRKTEL